MHKVNPLSTITEAVQALDGRWVNLVCSLGHKTVMAADEYVRRTGRATRMPWSSQEVCPDCRCLEALLPASLEWVSGECPSFFTGKHGSGVIPFGKP